MKATVAASPKSTAKLYWYGSGGDILAETDACGNTTAEYIFFGGKRIAMIPWSGASCSSTVVGNPIYYVEDLLGTSRVITDASGVVCYDADFYPFGGERPYTNTCPQNYKFEGKERDAETGNDDFGARYHTSSMGRFMTPDWSTFPQPVPFGNSADPQSLNLFAHVRNNPSNLVDIDGHSFECQDYRKTDPDVGGNYWTTNCLAAQQSAPPSANPKPSTACTYAFDACTPGSLNADAQPNLAAMKNQGPGGYDYGGVNLFDALRCAAANNPADSGCWGVTLTRGPGTFQGSWSIDTYAAARDRVLTYKSITQPTAQGIITVLNGPIVAPPDPLDPTQELFNLKPGPLPTPTSRAYVCPAVESYIRQLLPQSGSPSAAKQLASLQVMYRKSCL